MKVIFSQLSEIIEAFAVSAVEVQERLDDTYRADLVHSAKAAEILKTLSPEFAKALLPARQVVDQFELGCGIQVSTHKEQEAGIRVMPLNLAYETRFEASTTEESSIRVFIDQVPVQSETLDSSEEKPSD